MLQLSLDKANHVHVAALAQTLPSLAVLQLDFKVWYLSVYYWEVSVLLESHVSEHIAAAATAAAAAAAGAAAAANANANTLTFGVQTHLSAVATARQALAGLENCTGLKELSMRSCIDEAGLQPLVLPTTLTVSRQSRDGLLMGMPIVCPHAIRILPTWQNDHDLQAA